MLTLSRPARASVATAVAAVLIALGAVVPLLDRGHGVGHLAVSAEDAPAGYLGHLHSICLQHGAAAWAPAEGADLPSEAPVVVSDGPGLQRPQIAATLSRTHQPRAPPLG